MKTRFYNLKTFTVIASLFTSFGLSNGQSVTLTSGSSWTVPAGVSQLTVECWGAGGGGGYSSSSGRACGGGGGGAYSKKNVITVTPGQVISYAIGQGGSGGPGTFNGGDTWFLNSSTVLAKGGFGVGDNSMTGAAGGQSNASVGDIRQNGGQGGNGSQGGGSNDAGGGGGAAGTTSFGMTGGPGDNSANTAGTNGVRQGGSAGAGYPFNSTTPGRGGNGSDNGGSGDNAQNYAAGGGGAKKCDSGLCSSQNGGNGSQGVIVITYCLAPVLSGGISGSTTVCENATQVYTAPLITGATYNWTLPNGWSGTSTSNSITAVAGPNNGNVTVSVNTACGTSLNNLSLAVTAVGQAPVLSTITGSSSICIGAGSQVYSVVNNPAAATYTWTIPSGWSGTSASNSIVVTPTMNSGLISVVANSAGCGSSAPASLNITVLDIPVAPASIIGNSLVCEGNNVTYSVLNNPTVTYVWAAPSNWVGNGSTSNIFDVHVGSDIGVISVQSLNACGFSPSTDLSVSLGVPTSESISVHGCRTLEVNGIAYSTPGQYIQTLPNTAGCDSTLNIDVDLTNIFATYHKTDNIYSAQEVGATYSWVGCDDITTVLKSTNQFTPPANGEYRLIVEKNGCYDTSACFTYNKIGVDDYNHQISFSIYPNPASETVNISLKGIQWNNKATISITDITGKTISQKAVSLNDINQDISLNVRSLKTGIYFIKLEGDNLQVITQKLIIE